MLTPSFAQFWSSSPEDSRSPSGSVRANTARYRPLICGLAFVALAPASALAQHVHGVIELGVVVEGETVAVSLNAPLSDVVGFEYAPQSDEQIELVQRAAAMLADPDAMFGLPDSANCQSSEASVDGPAYLHQDVEAESTGETSHDDGHHQEDDSDHHDHGEHHDDDHHHDDDSAHHDHDEEHGDDHHHDGESDDHDHEHSADHDHDHDHEEAHAEVTANYEWMCDAPSNLDALELRFIDGFAGVENIQIQILTADGARVLTAGRDTGSVSLATE